MLKSSCPYEYFPEYGISDALLFLSFISPLGKDLLFPPLNCTQDFIKEQGNNIDAKIPRKMKYSLS